MKKVLLVDDSQLSIDGLVQNIDFQQLGLDIARFVWIPNLHLTI